MGFAFSYFLKKYPRLFPALVLAHFVENFLEVIGISLFIPLINFLSGSNSDSTLLGYTRELFGLLGLNLELNNLLIFICVLFVAKSFFVLGLRYVTAGLSAQFIEESSEDALSKITGSSLEEFQSLNRGEVCNILTEQLKRASTIVVWLMMIVASVISLALYLALASIISWQLLLVAVVAVGVFYGIISVVLRKAEQLGSDRAELSTQHNKTLLEFLEHLKYSKAIRKEDKLLENSTKDISRLAGNWQKVQFLSSSIVTAFQPMLAVSLSVVIVFAVKWGINFSELVVFLVTLQRAYPAISNIQNLKNNVMIHLPELRNVISLRELSRKEGITVQGSSLPFTDSISFSDISFSYGNDIVFSNLNFELKKGETLFIEGESGKGKSTLIDLFLGLRSPQSGKITIDKETLKGSNSAGWRDRVSYVPQNDVLLNDSVQENITYFADGFDKKEFEEALKLSGSFPFVDNLEGREGYKITDASDNLSGGQRQRLMIARAIYMNRDVYIFDEPTSALDESNEDTIISTLQELKSKGKTLVIVSHDKRLKVLADKTVSL